MSPWPEQLEDFTPFPKPRGGRTLLKDDAANGFPQLAAGAAAKFKLYKGKLCSTLNITSH